MTDKQLKVLLRSYHSRLAAAIELARDMIPEECKIKTTIKPPFGEIPAFGIVNRDVVVIPSIAAIEVFASELEQDIEQLSSDADSERSAA